VRVQHAYRDGSRLAPEPATFPPEPGDDVRRLLTKIKPLARNTASRSSCATWNANRSRTPPANSVAAGNRRRRLAELGKVLARRLRSRGLAEPCGAAVSVSRWRRRPWRPCRPHWPIGLQSAASCRVGPGAAYTSAKATALAHGCADEHALERMKRAAVVPLFSPARLGAWTTAALFSTPPVEPQQPPASTATTPPGGRARRRPRTPPARGFSSSHALFDRGAAKPAIDFVRVPDLMGRRQSPSWSGKELSLSQCPRRRQLKNSDIVTQRGWGLSWENSASARHMNGVNCDLMVKGKPVKAAGQSRLEDVALSFCLPTTTSREPGERGAHVVGTSIQVFRNFGSAPLKRRARKGRPRPAETWLEVTIVPDDGTHPVRLRLPRTRRLPRPRRRSLARPCRISSRRRFPRIRAAGPLSQGMEGVWTGDADRGPTAVARLTKPPTGSVRHCGAMRAS